MTSDDRSELEERLSVLRFAKSQAAYVALVGLACAAVTTWAFFSAAERSSGQSGNLMAVGILFLVPTLICLFVTIRGRSVWRRR